MSTFLGQPKPELPAAPASPWSEILGAPRPRMNFEASLAGESAELSLYYDRRFVGSLAYRFSQESKVAQVTSSYLLEEYVGRGLGKHLYAQAFEHAKHLGMREFRSDTDLSESAHHIWQSWMRRGAARQTNRQYVVELSQQVLRAGESAVNRLSSVSRLAKAVFRTSRGL